MIKTFRVTAIVASNYLPMSPPNPNRGDNTISPQLTGRRAFLALTVAVVADLLQLMLVPVSWTFAQAAIDVVAMLFVLPLLGFHLLLLPTFAIELIPGVAVLPTWTGCVWAVIALKMKAQRNEARASVIDVTEVKKPPVIEQSQK